MTAAAPSYWEKRYDAIYLRTISYIIRVIGRDAQSLIDVGSYKSPYIEEFYWIRERVSLDILAPYEGPGVSSIKMDFLEYTPDRKFDVVLCSQVVEHIPDAGGFCQKLFQTGKHVVISVPYMWPEGIASDHVHDPIDKEKLHSWTGRKPNFQTIVQEPFRGKASRRLVAYYDLENPESVVNRRQVHSRREWLANGPKIQR